MVQFLKSKVPPQAEAIAEYLSKSRSSGPDCSTHFFCNESAVAIMELLGNKQQADFFRDHMEELNAGTCWADTGYRNISHFFNPLTRKGLWNFPSAAVSLSRFIRQAIKFSHKANIGKAMFYTGAAAHLIQDMCVPHHSCSLLFDGHKEFEHWVMTKIQDYPLIPEKFNIEGAENPTSIFFKNAVISQGFLNHVNLKASEADFRHAADILLPLSQVSTVKMLFWIVNKMGWVDEAAENNAMAL
jgi:phospholipase C